MQSVLITITTFSFHPLLKLTVSSAETEKAKITQLSNAYSQLSQQGFRKLFSNECINVLLDDTSDLYHSATHLVLYAHVMAKDDAGFDTIFHIEEAWTTATKNPFTATDLLEKLQKKLIDDLRTAAKSETPSYSKAAHDAFHTLYNYAVAKKSEPKPLEWIKAWRTKLPAGTHYFQAGPWI